MLRECTLSCTRTKAYLVVLVVVVVFVVAVVVVLVVVVMVAVVVVFAECSLSDRRVFAE